MIVAQHHPYQYCQKVKRQALMLFLTKTKIKLQNIYMMVDTVVLSCTCCHAGKISFIPCLRTQDICLMNI